MSTTAKKISTYAAVALVSFLIAFAVMDLWDADLTIPFEHHGDGLLHATILKATVEQGWPLTIERLGAPGELDFRDFPALDNLTLALIRIAGFAVPQTGLLLNLVFLLTFPLISITAFAIARRLGLSTPSAFVVAILYAMLPYHFRRSVGHLFLTNYFLIPPAVWLLYLVSRGEPLFAGRRRMLSLVLLAVLLGCSGVYYPFFTCALLVPAALTGWIVTRRGVRFAEAMAVIAIIFLTVALNFAPSIAKNMSEGSLAAKREKADSERYGLKIAQLILPITEHRISEFERVKRRYNAYPLVNENDVSSLGAAGAAGFLLLLFWLLFRKPEAPALNYGAPVLNHLSILNLWAVLIGTIGGFAGIFALLITPQIRAFNRISIFIAYFSLIAFGIAFDRLSRNWTRRWARGAAAAVIVVIGTLDQTNSNFARLDSDQTVPPFRRFVQSVERSLPAGAMVFQLPYFPFPEAGSIGGIGDYEHFKAYVHSKTLRWSYGAVRNSTADALHQEIASMEPRRMTDALVLAGFEGIWIDRRAYADAAAELERELTLATGAIPFVSETGQQSFFPLRLARYRLAKSLGPEQFAAAMGWKPVLVSWRGGFQGLEGPAEDPWRWCSRKGTMMLHNLGDTPRQVKISFSVETGRDEPSTLRLSGLWTAETALAAGPVPLQATITVPPGSHSIEFRSSAKPITSPDPRTLVFSITDFVLDDPSVPAVLKPAA